jgi:hypothetical protein
MSWFEDLYPKIPRNFPPDLVLEVGKKYRLLILDEAPRKVRGGYGRLTAVIAVQYEGTPRSFYVGSHVDLARQISNIQLNHNNSLKNLIIEVVKKEKKGRNYLFDVKIIHRKARTEED